MRPISTTIPGRKGHRHYPISANGVKGFDNFANTERMAGVRGCGLKTTSGICRRRTDEVGEPQLTKLTQTLGIKRIVVAHTPQANGQIRQRFGGKVFLIDTGLVIGRASALEISGNRIRAIYLNGQVDFN